MSKCLLRSAALLICLGASPSAWAAPVFPGASGVGLDPPKGMTAAPNFNGFRDGLASIVITEMPKVAYAAIDAQRSMFTSRLGADKADDVTINGVHGFLIKGTQPAGAKTFRKWVLVLDAPEETALVSVQAPSDDTAVSDAAIDTALRTVVFRPRPGLAEQVAALPFSVGDMAGFKVSATSLGAALILVDDKSADAAQQKAHVVILSNAGTPPKDGRVEFAKKQLQSFQAVRTTGVVSAKALDAGGGQWVEVDAKGSEGQSETPVAISYFVRFDPAGTLSVVCVAPQDAAAQFADRFKSVALSVKPKG